MDRHRIGGHHAGDGDIVRHDICGAIKHGANRQCCDLAR